MQSSHGPRDNGLTKVGERERERVGATENSDAFRCLAYFTKSVKSLI